MVNKEEALTAAQKYMLYTVSLDMSAPHSVVGAPPVTDDWSCDNCHPNKGCVLCGQFTSIRCLLLAKAKRV